MASIRKTIHKQYHELHVLLDMEEVLTLKGDHCVLQQSTLDLAARIDSATAVIAGKLASGGGTGPTTAEVDALLTPRATALEALAGTPAPTT